MDEVEMVRRLLAEQPPSAVMAARVEQRLAQSFAADSGRASPLPPTGTPALRLNSGGPAFGGRPPGRQRRWGGWLAPAAAAAAVIAVVAGALTISGAIGRHAGPRTATDSAVAAVAAAGVPRYFVALTGHALPYQGQRAEVVATATGAVLGSVTAPKPYTMFTEVAAAGDDQTFVLAAQHGVPVSPHFPKLTGTGPAKLYKLVLHRSGKPATLTALPAPPVTGSINGFALSPDGSKLAVSILPPINAGGGGKIEVFTLATGAARTWTWQGSGFVGSGKPVAQSLSWEADSRTLLFRNSGTTTASAYLLDTSGPGGSLSASSKRIPILSQELSGRAEGGLQISGPFLLITGDGTKIVAPTSTLVSQGSSLMTPGEQHYLASQPHRQCGAYLTGFTKQNGHYTGVRYTRYRKTASCLRLIQEREQYFRRNVAPRADHVTLPTSDVTITEFSVKTGKPVAVLDRQATQDQGWTAVDWVSASGTSLIAVVPGVPGADHTAQEAIGVQDGDTFTPLPATVQHTFLTEQLAW